MRSSLLPLADLYAITFAAPLFITALSVPMLGEHVGARRWAAIGVGFVGVLVILRPGGEVFSLGGLDWPGEFAAVLLLDDLHPPC